MIFNRHSELTDLHAFLGASKYHWINYDDEKLESAFASYQNVKRGTVLHEFASQCIRLKQKLPKSKKTLNRFVIAEIAEALGVSTSTVRRTINPLPEE